MLDLPRSESGGLAADRPPNYRIIAGRCGVGKSTVGRVLQGSGHVSEETRQRVLAAVRELGYQPDPGLAALSRRRWPHGAKPRTATIAYIHTAASPLGKAGSPEFSGASERARQMGYAMDFFDVADYPTSAALSRVLYSRGIQGVVIQAYRDGCMVELDWKHFHAVFVGPENDVPRVHNVQGDFRNALHLATAEAVSRGYRRPGFALMNFLASGTNIPFRAQALFERSKLEAELGPQPPLFIFDPKDSLGAGFGKWMWRFRPDVVISTNSQPFYWITEPSGGRGARRPLRIPGDVGFICLRRVPDLPQVAQMDLREFEQGVQAVNLLHQHLQHGLVGLPAIPLRVLVPPRFVDGPSLPDKCRFFFKPPLSDDGDTGWSLDGRADKVLPAGWPSIPTTRARHRGGQSVRADLPIGKTRKPISRSLRCGRILRPSKMKAGFGMRA